MTRRPLPRAIVHATPEPLDYAESTRCRVETLRRYFAEPDAAPCRRCDDGRDPLHGVAAGAVAEAVTPARASGS